MPRAGTPTPWANVMYLLDLGADVLEWRVEEQPFTRRAFIAAARVF